MTTPTPITPNPELKHAMTGLIIALPLGLGLIGFTVLYFMNKRTSIINKPKTEDTKVVKYLKIFFKYILLELISLVFAIVNIVGLETSSWAPFDMTTIKIFFYVFLALKYLILLFNTFEEKFEKIIVAVANTGYVPPCWPELLETWIFIPVVIIDGMMINISYRLQSDGDLIPYDSIVLMILDTLLFIKACVMDSLTCYEISLSRWNILAIFYSLVENFYTLFLVFMFIVMQLPLVLESTGSLKLDHHFEAKLVLIVVFLHPIVSRFTSMCLQGIIFTNRNRYIRQAFNARVQALRLYIRWFDPAWYVWIIVGVVYGFTWYMYISLYYAVFHLYATNERPEPFIQGSILGLVILTTIFTVFFMINLGYATLKRLGVFIKQCFGCAFPIDCESYAKEMNVGLVECNASFQMNSFMQVDR